MECQIIATENYTHATYTFFRKAHTNAHTHYVVTLSFCFHVVVAGRWLNLGSFQANDNFLKRANFDWVKIDNVFFFNMYFILQNPTKYDSSGGRKDGDKTIEHTTAVVVRRGMRGMSSMGKPVSMRPTSDSNSVLLNNNNAKVSSVLSPTPPVNEFTCTCATGWTGPTCEISK